MSANHRFSLTASACSYPLEVLAFSGDEAISTPYSFDIELVCERSDLDLEALLHTPAFLAFDSTPVLSGGVAVLGLPAASGVPGQRYVQTPWLQMVEHCLTHFPECLQGADSSARQQRAIDCCDSAECQGYSAEDEVMRWVALYGYLGKTFPAAPEHDVYHQLLAERNVLPGQRLDNLLAELNRQIAFAEIAL